MILDIIIQSDIVCLDDHIKVLYQRLDSGNDLP